MNESKATKNSDYVCFNTSCVTVYSFAASAYTQESVNGMIINDR